ncbi:MAG: FAD-dependent oxidoreductase [Candidatus Bathyarchaeia archaeon]
MGFSTRFLIVGGGAAGMSAVEGIRMVDAYSPVTVVSGERHPFYYRRNLAWYIAGRVSLEKLIAKPIGYYEGLGVKVLRGVEALRLDAIGHVVESSLGSISYGRLLIASGAEPFKPEVKGLNLDGVYTLRTLDDAEEIRSRLMEASHVLVVGGGLLGLNLAEAAVANGVDATILERGDRLSPGLLDEASSSLLAKRLSENGVRLVFGEKLEALRGDGRVESAQTSGGHVIPCEMAFIAVGVRPSIRWIRDSPIETGKGILVDDRLRSSVEDVYAAGDVAEAYDPVLGGRAVHTSWSNAEEQGRIAGENMAGRSSRYEGSITANMESVFSLSFVSIGLANPTGEGYEVYSSASEDPPIYRKMVMLGNHLVGAILVGDMREAEAIRNLIRGKVDLSSYKRSIRDDTIDFREIA